VGYAKEMMLRELEQGFHSVSSAKVVCAKCFTDEAIQAFIRDRVSERKCSYCGRRSKKPIAAPMNDVLGLIVEGLNHEYADPIEENARDDGEWVIDPRDTADVLAGMDTITENRDVFDEIVSSITSDWVDRPLWGPSEGDFLRYGWDDFVEAVKYDRRYLFLMPKEDRYSSGGLTPDKMLDQLGEVITQVGLVRTMNAGTRWYRARVHGLAKKYTSATDLGTAPREAALSSNRMSPLGIPMFYGAENEATAIAETYAPKPGTPEAVTVAQFRTARDASVVDFTVLPKVPSLFDQENWHRRGPIWFLRDFVEDLVRPIEKDGREHVDYVPTQVVTEYLRHVFRTETGHPVQGVIYRSARTEGGKCCVLFVGNDECCEGAPGWENDQEKRLGLTGKPKRHEYP